MSSGVNMLTNSVKNIDSTKKEFLELILFQGIKKHVQNTSLQIQEVFRTL